MATKLRFISCSSGYTRLDKYQSIPDPRPRMLSSPMRQDTLKVLDLARLIIVVRQIQIVLYEMYDRSTLCKLCDHEIMPDRHAWVLVRVFLLGCFVFAFVAFGGGPNHS
jgi:hypothetical protein